MLFVPALQGVESFTVLDSLTNASFSLRQNNEQGSRSSLVYGRHVCKPSARVFSLSNSEHCDARNDGLFGSQG